VETDYTRTTDTQPSPLKQKLDKRAIEQTIGLKSDSKLRVHQKSTTFYGEKNVKPMYIDT
jgi:hypothetical protein